jgi:hypothetical protein
VMLMYFDMPDSRCTYVGEVPTHPVDTSLLERFGIRPGL